jgi:formylglycine-generating enzyme required for sulfatase activity
MGSASASADDDEKPIHSVTLSAFRMGATPVTVAVWKEYCAATGATLPSAPTWGLLDNHPVVNVSWNDIMGSDGKSGYCAWASRVAGVSLILPSEAQWEYSAKDGKDSKYPWGNEFDVSKVWGSNRMIRSGTADVCRTNNVFDNKFGVIDLCSNVWEWCLDGYQPYAKSFFLQIFWKL